MLFRKQHKVSQLEKFGSIDMGPTSRYIFQETTRGFAARKSGTTELGPISRYVVQETTRDFAAEQNSLNVDQKQVLNT